MDIAKTKKADTLLGKLLFPFFSLSRKRPLDRNPKTILLIQLWGIGETILVLPALKALRALFPNASISMLCTDRNKEVFFQNPSLNNILVIEPSLGGVVRFLRKQRRSYDLAIDFEEYLNIATLIAFIAGKSSLGFATHRRGRLYDKAIPYDAEQHCAETFLDLVRTFHRIPKIRELERLKYSPKDTEQAEEMIDRHRLTGKRIIVLAPSVAESSKSRMWPKGRFQKLTERLLGLKRYPVVFIGGPDDKEAVAAIAGPFGNRVVDLSGSMDLRTLFAFVERSSLMISNDSGPMHIAAAQGIPTIGLFGPNTPVRFRPMGNNKVMFYRPESCGFSPCINVHEGKVPDCLFAKNIPDYQKCMKAISVDEVFRAAEQLLRKKNS